MNWLLFRAQPATHEVWFNLGTALQDATSRSTASAAESKECFTKADTLNAISVSTVDTCKDLDTLLSNWQQELEILRQSNDRNIQAAQKTLLELNEDLKKLIECEKVNVHVAPQSQSQHQSGAGIVEKIQSLSQHSDSVLVDWLEQHGVLRVPNARVAGGQFLYS